MTPRVLAYDDDGIEVSTRPSPCGGCGRTGDRVYLYLDTVIDNGQLHGMQVMSESLYCCNHAEPIHLPAQVFATVLEHLHTCPNHQPTNP